MKNVRAFKATDKVIFLFFVIMFKSFQLPLDGSKEQHDAYEIALKMFNGEYINEEDNQSDFEDGNETKDEVENEIEESTCLKKKKSEPKQTSSSNFFSFV